MAAASWPGAEARGIVIHGPGAFIESATDYPVFARAFLRKLRRELSPLTSRACTYRCTITLYDTNLLDFFPRNVHLRP